jgi:apolipoprotein N-acyltransferase
MLLYLIGHEYKKKRVPCQALVFAASLLGWRLIFFLIFLISELCYEVSEQENKQKRQEDLSVLVKRSFVQGLGCPLVIIQQLFKVLVLVDLLITQVRLVDM